MALLGVPQLSRVAGLHVNCGTSRAGFRFVRREPRKSGDLQGLLLVICGSCGSCEAGAGRRIGSEMVGEQFGELLNTAKVISGDGVDTACAVRAIRRFRARNKSTRRAMSMAMAEPRVAAMTIVLEIGTICWSLGCADVDASVGITKIVVEIVDARSIAVAFEFDICLDV